MSGNTPATWIGGLIDVGMGSNPSDAFFGVEYEQLEYVEIRLGDAADTVTIEDTPDTTAFGLLLGGGDDSVVVNALNGDTEILGGAGDDTVQASQEVIAQAQLGTELSFQGDAHRREDVLTRLTTDPSPDFSEFLANPSCG